MDKKINDIDDDKLTNLITASASSAIDVYYRSLTNNAQSPIEALFLVAMWSRGCWSERLTIKIDATLDELIRGAARQPHKMQGAAQVDIGRYRVDFVMVLNRFGRKDPFILAIECDGHDHHEKTKEQAQHDKSRDRALTAAGCTVLRFTGSEIWKDAGKCADEAFAVMHGLKQAEYAAFVGLDDHTGDHA